MEYNREELISICEDAVIHHTKWENRDSYSSQVLVSSIYEGLTSGLDFVVEKDTDELTIWILFENVDINKLQDSKYLDICSREDYFKNCDPDYETEMFTGNGIDFSCDYIKRGYLPTRKRLDTYKGYDWY